MAKADMRFRCATKRWDELSVKERAVLLAKDVISLLELSDGVRVSPGTYCRVESETIMDPRGDLKALFENMNSCDVCAKGALFVANTLGRNAVTGQRVGIEFDFNPDGSFGADINDEGLMKSLCKSVGRATADNIEDAFETNWSSEYPDPTKRLIAIMETVIANGGKFSTADVERFDEPEPEASYATTTYYNW